MNLRSVPIGLWPPPGESLSGTSMMLTFFACRPKLIVRIGLISTSGTPSTTDARVTRAASRRATVCARWAAMASL